MSEPLEVIVGQLLLKHKLTLALAESCTGGLVGHRITDVPGSSAYLIGGIVAYSYDAKELLLGVRHNTLYDHGAVSAETAVEMARGARRALGADIGISVTGIGRPAQQQSGLLNFYTGPGTHQVTASNGKLYADTTNKQCYMVCHGKNHNPCSYSNC